MLTYGYAYGNNYPKTYKYLQSCKQESIQYKINFKKKKQILKDFRDSYWLKGFFCCLLLFGFQKMPVREEMKEIKGLISIFWPLFNVIIYNRDIKTST